MSGRWRRFAHRALLGVVGVLGLGLLLPGGVTVPVEGATRRDWNPRSFWFEPWGASGVHKGIDIFAPRGRAVVAAAPGVVVFRGTWGDGGHVVAVLGPKWRMHYYAHLVEGSATGDIFVGRGEPIGQVGTSGNAVGKSPHLHYAVVSLVPLPWRYSTATQGWKRMFYLDPGGLLEP
jgi:murein DD-endopeptidase MepM/ murein hydrolase activator NlpD